MKKNQIIGLIIFLAIAIPGIGFGIYYGINYFAEGAIEGAEVSINSVEVQSADESSLTVNMSGEIKNPTSIDATIDPMNLSVGYDGKIFGTTQTTSISAQAGNSSFNQICEIIITDSDQFNLFLTSFVKNPTVTVDISGTANITTAGVSINKEISKSIEIDGQTEDLIRSIKLLFLTLEVIPTSELNAYVNATLYNPFNFAFNITYLEYDAYFDDADGVITPGYAPKNNILIEHIEKNYSSSPIEMNPKAHLDVEESISSTDVELVTRLFDENFKNQLEIDIKNGIMHGSIGEFTFEIEFSFTDIPLSVNSSV